MSLTLDQTFNQALEQGNCDTVETMLAEGYVPPRDCIVVVCSGGYIDLLLLLLRRKVDLDLQVGLTVAVYFGHVGLIDHLYIYGADINQPDIIGNTCLHLANTAHMCQKLLDMGAVQVTNNIGKYPLHCTNDVEVVKLLLRWPDSISHQDNRGDTPLYKACCFNNLSAIEILLQYPQGQEAIKLTNENGYTPLNLACYHSQLHIVTLLLQYPQGQDAIKIADKDGYTPLYWSCFHNNLPITKLLLQYPQGHNSPKSGLTPIYWARNRKNQDMIDLLTQLSV